MAISLRSRRRSEDDDRGFAPLAWASTFRISCHSGCGVAPSLRSSSFARAKLPLLTSNCAGQEMTAWITSGIGSVTWNSTTRRL